MRGGGACAGAAYDYITRENEYDDPERDPAVYTESGNVPDRAEEDPREYWDAADVYDLPSTGHRAYRRWRFTAGCQTASLRCA